MMILARSTNALNQEPILNTLTCSDDWKESRVLDRKTQYPKNKLYPSKQLMKQNKKSLAEKKNLVPLQLRQWLSSN